MFQTELDGYFVSYRYGFPELFAWYPLRHKADDAHGFGIQFGTDAMLHLDVGDAAIGANKKLYDNPTLYSGLLCCYGIFDIS